MVFSGGMDCKSLVCGFCFVDKRTACVQYEFDAVAAV